MICFFIPVCIYFYFRLVFIIILLCFQYRSITLSEAQTKCEDSPSFSKSKNVAYVQWSNFTPKKFTLESEHNTFRFSYISVVINTH